MACAVQTAVETVGGKWKPGILFRLLDGPRRASDLLHAMPWVSERVLLRALRELETAGVVARQSAPGFPRRTYVALTPHGAGLRPLLEELGRWGTTHLARGAE